MQDWQRTLTAQVAGSVEHYRRQRGFRRSELAARCTALGLPTKRPALAGLLDGRRQTITLQEVVVLAQALEVSVAELLVPLHTGDPALSSPTRTEHAFAAAIRLLGLGPDGSTSSAPAYRPYIRYLRAVDRFARANRRLAEISHRVATGTLAPHHTDGYPHPASEIVAAEAALHRLIDARDDLARRRLTAPPVPEHWPFLHGGPPPRRLPIVDDRTAFPLFQYDRSAGQLPEGHRVTGP